MPSRSEIDGFLTRLFKKRQVQSSKSEGKQYPLGLDQAQVDNLRQLIPTPAWQGFSVALRAVCDKEIAKIISGLTHDQYLLQCGRVQTLLDVLSLPETIDQKAREIDEHNRPADTGPSPKRDLTFFGSPFWSPSRKPNIHGPNEPSGSVARP